MEKTRVGEGIRIFKMGEIFMVIIQSKVLFFSRVLENINKRRETCQEIENESLW